jgi:hypothetical protein
VQLEELKSKERTILQLQQQLNLQTGRAQVHRERLLQSQNELRPHKVSAPIANAELQGVQHTLSRREEASWEI